MKKILKKVSIIVIVYNSEKSLSKCLDSCINQTYENIEIIIVNDGSKDKSLDIAESYQKTDTRIQIISKPNEGIPKTRRAGFERSSGDYIYHLDADDYLDPVAIEKLIATAKNEKADIVVGGLIFENKSGERIISWITNINGKSREDHLKNLFLSAIPPFIFGKLIKREVFEPVKVPAEYNCGEDIISNVMMICYNPTLKIVSVPTPVQHYLVYDSSLTNSSPAESFLKFTDTITRILIECDLEKEVLKEWAWFRVIKSWRYYLRRGGKQFLTDKKYVSEFYQKYYTVVQKQLSFMEKLELNLYRYNQFLGYSFSRIYVKGLKIFKLPVN